MGSNVSWVFMGIDYLINKCGGVKPGLTAALSCSCQADILGILVWLGLRI